MEELLRVSASQEGLLTQEQIDAVALLPGQFPYEDWERRGPLVLAWRGAPDTPARRLLAAVLDAGDGAAISGPTAAAWWGLPGFRTDVIHVVRPRRPRRRVAAVADVVHEPRVLPSRYLTVLNNVPVVRPELMAVELFVRLPAGRATRAVDNAWSRRLLDGAGLRRAASEMATTGRPGAAAVRAFLAARPDDWVPPQSGLEGRFDWLIRRSSLGTWRRQVEVGGDAGWTGRVDFLCRELPVVVEVQSELFHAALADRDLDARRHERLRADGFELVEAWEHELWHDPDQVAEAVLQAFAAARTAALRGERVAVARD